MGNGTDHVFAREIEEIVDNMTLMDDDLMSRVFDQNVLATEVVLRTILGEEIEVVETKAQCEMESPIVGGRTIRLDIFARSNSGDYFNCEIQRSNRGAIPRRARFHSSMMDSRMITAGEGYANLKDSYVIFITENDYFHEGKPLYRFLRREDNGLLFDDGSYIIYVNGEYEGDDDIGRLLSDFRRRDLTGFNYPELESGVRQFKEGMEGRRAMCEAVEKYAEKYAEGKYDTGVIRGKEEGIIEGRVESIHALMVNLHLSAEQAMESIGIPKSEFEKYKQML
ncbi:MAG: PD-(D/E)XK nuclease family transposase [Lachnospiraceae bacterium]|nr:PD-(D/E)XK nuclease family transposase [Lachnospiraceae bacterium]